MTRPYVTITHLMGIVLIVGFGVPSHGPEGRATT